MATFHPNPSYENEPWIERPLALAENAYFRNWHVMFFCFMVFVTFVILSCCCIKIRVPRTKQDIEADYQRKKLASKFKERLRLIQNQYMDDIDLKRALEIIQEDYKTESKNIEDQMSVQMFPDYNITDSVTKNLLAEPQQPSTTGMGKIMALVKLKKLRQQQMQNVQPL